MNVNKRDLLKGLAVGTAWSTPVVSTVILPAHAQTSLLCGSATAIDLGTSDGPDFDDMFLVFDCFSCDLIVYDEAPDSVPNSIVELTPRDINSDEDPISWDADSFGGQDWNVVTESNNWNGPGDGHASDANTESGIYTLRATRLTGPCADEVFIVTLDIEFSGEGTTNTDGFAQIEVSASIRPL